MKIRKIALESFMLHDNSTLDLPETGVVVLTGLTGSGKSTFVEAASYAMSGSTLRETPPWRLNEAGCLKVDTDLGQITRSQSAKGTKKIAWLPAGESSAIKGDTPTKSAQKITEIFGSHDVWRRTHVFSSADAAHFTSATDSQRKALIQKILGIDRFDIALSHCRKRIAAEKVEHARLAQALTLARHKLASEERSLAESMEPKPPVLAAPTKPDVDPQLDAKTAYLNQQIEKHKHELSELSTQALVEVPREHISEASTRRAEFDAARKELQRVLAGKCPTCEQPYPVSEVDARAALGAAETALQEADDKVNQLSRAAELANALTRSTVAKVTASLRDLEYQARTLQGDEARLRAYEISLEQHAQSQAAAEAQYQTLLAAWTAKREIVKNQIFEFKMEILDHEEALAAQSIVLAELATCEKVLGLQGVRVSVLSHALDAATQLTNAFLAQMNSPITVEVLPYTKLKDGNTNSEISITVQGAGGGYGYKATSGGERRSVDVMLLLALSDVAAAAAGKEPGTLFIDEVFDTLDLTLCAAVVGVIAELGKQRCVVVITHREELATLLVANQAQWRKVESGRLVS